MKSRIAPHTLMTAKLIGAMTLLLVGFQNCSNSMNFDGTRASQMAKTDAATNGDTGTTGSDPSLGDGAGPIVEPVTDRDMATPIITTPAGTTPPSSSPPTLTQPNPVPRDHANNPSVAPRTCGNDNDDDDNDDDDSIDYDHHGRRIKFKCATGAKRGFEHKNYSHAPDIVVEPPVTGFIVRRPVNNVTVHNIEGAVAIVRMANHIADFSNVKSAISAVRAVTVDRMSGIQSPISAAATVTLKELSNVESEHLCASGRDIGKISGIQSRLVKIRGQWNQKSAVPRAQEISNIKSDMISISRLDATKISGIEGELIIRNSVIDEISGLKGGLTLINSTVRVLKDSGGKLRLKNSTIGTKSNVEMTAEVVGALK